MTDLAITWGGLREGLRQWISILSGNPASAIIWSDEGRPIADPMVILSITSDLDQHYRTTQEVVDDGFQESAETVKQLTVQCRVETCQQTDYTGALQVADRIRVRSFLPSLAAKLAEGIVIYTEPSGLTSVTYDASGQRIHGRTFDMFVRFKLRETYTETNAEYFDKVSFSVTSNPGNVTSPIIEVP